jgi:hypothetical protein
MSAGLRRAFLLEGGIVAVDVVVVCNQGKGQQQSSDLESWCLSGIGGCASFASNVLVLTQGFRSREIEGVQGVAWSVIAAWPSTGENKYGRVSMRGSDVEGRIVNCKTTSKASRSVRAQAGEFAAPEA